MTKLRSAFGNDFYKSINVDSLIIKLFKVGTFLKSSYFGYTKEVLYKFYLNLLGLTYVRFEHANVRFEHATRYKTCMKT